MRTTLLICLIAATLLVGCAYEGVIVQKNSAPQPFYESIGIDSSYAFLLRDRAGAMHRQLVTPEVFERYAVGDYFNDLQPAPARKEMVDGKTMRMATHSPAATTRRVAKVRKTSKSTRITTARKHKTRKHTARRSRHRAPVSKVAHVQQAPQITQTKQAEILLVRVVRCR